MHAFKWILPIVCAAVCSSCIFGADNGRRRAAHELWHQRKLTHTGKILSGSDLTQISGLKNETHFREMLQPILVPRVVDTPSHAAVRKHIVGVMRDLGWTIEEDSFMDDTPIGSKRFTNILATLDPSIPRRLVVACHYDSKLTPTGFIGAIDSAVPCAMMLNLAKVMKRQLDAYSSRNQEVTLQFLFFDGEEAFVRWSDADSLYGARRLASKLHRSSFPPGNRQSVSELDRIDLFVLLDLIGTEDCGFYSLFQDSDRWFEKIAVYEQQLRASGLLSRRPPLFNSRKLFGSGIEDDHVPFLQRGVPILHLISVPFPTVWHKAGDNQSALHYPTIEDMNTLVRVFVADYLGLRL